MYDAIVIGGGHNGLVCAAYLARAGMRTIVVEARPATGGCASTVDAVGARVNICNCDHLSVRTTTILDELALAEHGLRYLDVDPAQLSVSWSGDAPWYLFHDEARTLESLRRTHPDEVDAYQRYLRSARPVAELVLEMATTVPTVPNAMRRVLDRRGDGVRTLLAWSRMSIGEVFRSFFRSEALRAPAIVTGPAVWGLAPEAPRTGMAAIGYALKHVGQVGRPAGGSGSLPVAVEASFVASGGEVRTGVAVEAILVAGDAVSGVELSDGTELLAPRVVVACDPTAAFTRWVRNPPASMAPLATKWATRRHADGYESKIDAVIDAVPVLRGHERAHPDLLGVDRAWIPTTIVAPSIVEIAEAHRLMGEGRVAPRPMFFVNIPSVVDPAMTPVGGGHVLSLEVLFTPYALAGGWDSSPEPQRWLETFAGLVEGDFLSTIRDWRVMTPPRYEREFNLRRGHAPSFGGGPVAALIGRDRELTRYETPVRGLFLTGAATFPGAGVWGASGRNAAHVVLRGERAGVRQLAASWSRRASNADSPSAPIVREDRPDASTKVHAG